MSFEKQRTDDTLQDYIHWINYLRLLLISLLVEHLSPTKTFINSHLHHPLEEEVYADLEMQLFDSK